MLNTLPMLDGAVCVPASVCVPAEVAWPSLLSRSGQQVLGSCGLAQLSLEAGPLWKAVCGAQGEKRNAAENTSSPSLETARDAAKRSENSDLSGHNDTAQCSGFL